MLAQDAAGADVEACEACVAGDGVVVWVEASS